MITYGELIKIFCYQIFLPETAQISDFSNKSKCCMLYQNNQQCRVIVKVKEIPIGTPQVITMYGRNLQFLTDNRGDN